MKRSSVSLCFLLVGSILIGGTIFRERVASAAANLFVTVSNVPSQPVPTTIENARHAFAVFINETNEDSVRFNVPAGKRLVIESVSVETGVPAGQKLLAGVIQAHVNGDLEDYFMAPTFTGTLGSNDIYIASQKTTLYADGGTEIVVFALRSASTGGRNLNVSIQGYLIDCLAGPCA